MSESSYIMLNGELTEASTATISPVNRGMMYGDGCFETLRSYSGTFLGWEQHFKRLMDGLHYLEMDAAFSSKALKNQVLQLLGKNRLSDKDALIRIQCWRKGERGYSTQSRKISWMIQATKIHAAETPLKLAIAETRCIPSKALERTYKLSNGLNYIKAAQEAVPLQCDDALMLTINDNISETTSANIFWVSEEIVYTPSVNCDLLPGITRSKILGIIKTNGYKLIEGKFRLVDLKKAETVFCTNSVIEILEVESISIRKTLGDKKSEVKVDEILYDTGHPILKQIKKAFLETKLKELKT